MTEQLIQTPSTPIAPATPPPVSRKDDDVRPTELPYHRLALTHPRPRWWRPLLTVLLSALAYAALATVLVVAGVVVSFVHPGVDAAMTTWSESDMDDLGTPVGLVLGLGTIALMIPAVAIGVRLAERSRLGRLSSVTGRLRGGLLLPMLVLAVLVFVPVLVADAFLQWRQGRLDVTVTRPALLLIALALLVVPFQAAAEEYVFRALPQQVLGAWLRSPWWGILVPIPFFVLGHTYDLYGQINIGIFALAMGVLVWRTRGLEAAIALHVVNNLVVSGADSVGLSEAVTHEVTAAMFWSSNAVTVVFTVLAIAYHSRVTGRLGEHGRRARTAATKPSRTSVVTDRVPEQSAHASPTRRATDSVGDLSHLPGRGPRGPLREDSRVSGYLRRRRLR